MMDDGVIWYAAQRLGTSGIWMHWPAHRGGFYSTGVRVLFESAFFEPEK